MAERHISLPKLFSGGDVKDWFQRFEICARANGWEAATKATRLPTLLEGEALAIWLELSNEQQEDYKIAKEEIEKAMKPMGFVSLDDFHRRKLQPGEALSVFVHDLKKLIDQAIPNMAKEAKEPLLLHQFLTGLPGPITRQLRASGDIKTLEAAMTRARLLMTIDAEPVAMVDEKPSEVQRLTEQVALLTEQVAALSTQQRNRQSGSGRQPRCFGCNKVGHVQRLSLPRPYMFCLWAARAYRKKLPATGKRTGGRLDRATGAPFKCRATMISGKLGRFAVEFMLDSGSSVSLIRHDLLKSINITEVNSSKAVQLITASGDPLPILKYVKALVQLGELKICHEFVVVNSLVTPAILGADFLQGNCLSLDFSQTPVAVCGGHNPSGNDNIAVAQVLPIYEAAQAKLNYTCALPTEDEIQNDVVDECAVPSYINSPKIELPNCVEPKLKTIVEKYKEIFCTIPGKTNEGYHFIPTNGNPVKIPPRRIPAHYRAEVTEQIQTMLEQGIIARSKSPWMAPAVFVPKRTGQVHICVDYRELNKHTVKDSYPLPLPDEVQDKLAGSSIFSTLDLHSGYW